METKQKDYFANTADSYESDTKRVDNVANIANTILKELNFTKEMSIMDFGSGTGLLLSHIAPHVDKITAVDLSNSMNKTLSSKKSTIPCNLEILELDLSKDSIDDKFDSIISSMTIHHVEDISKIFQKFYNLLKSGGTIALSDLDTEDGTFHSKDMGVFHKGFDRQEFLNSAKLAGFKNLKIQTVSTIEKPRGTYSVFLLTGTK